MYESYFGFRKKPFAVTPDPEFFHPSESHREGLAHLRFAMREGLGFMVLSGEVGSGKTHLIRLLLSEFGPEVRRALILNPVLDPDDLVTAILIDLEVPIEPEMELSEKMDAFVRFLIGEHEAGRRVVIIVDESQNLSIQALERLRLLSNLETAGTKLLQIILVGQPELNLLLKLPPLRQLNQRINARHHLGPLSRADTEAYVRHRLLVAGGAENEVSFAPGALSLIHKVSGGIPRLISILCDYCLVIAFTEETHVVSAKIAREAIGLHASRLPASRPRQLERIYRRRVLAPALAGAFCFLCALALTGWNFRNQVFGALLSPREQVAHATSTAANISSDLPILSEASVEPETAQKEENGIPSGASPRPAVQSLLSEEDLAPKTPRTVEPEPARPQVSSGSPAPANEPGLASAPLPKVESSIPQGSSLPPKEASVQTEPENPAPRSISKSAESKREGTKYGVQIASLKTIEKARQAAKEVNRMGPVYLVPWTSPQGVSWVKVVLGAYEDVSEAKEIARKLDEEGKAKGARVVENRWWDSPNRVVSPGT
ncbi:MAG: AAA family ATPase [Candidatus Omnitrophica bacterium]|nr:AAA family ATPase [Candidatus Omnitrophota bacterium]